MLKKAMLLPSLSASNAKPQDMPLFSRFKATFGLFSDTIAIYGTATTTLYGKFELISGSNLVNTRGDRKNSRVIAPVPCLVSYCTNEGDQMKVCGVVNETTGYEAFGVYFPYTKNNSLYDGVVFAFEKRKQAEDFIVASLDKGNMADIYDYINVPQMVTEEDVGKEFIISIYMDA